MIELAIIGYLVDKTYNLELVNSNIIPNIIMDKTPPIDVL
jgi:hypothetical protein